MLEYDGPHTQALVKDYCAWTEEIIELSKTMDSFDDILETLTLTEDSNFSVFRVIPKNSYVTYYIAGQESMHYLDMQKLIEEEQGKSFEDLGWQLSTSWVVKLKKKDAASSNISRGPLAGEVLLNAAKRSREPRILVSSDWDPA